MRGYEVHLRGTWVREDTFPEDITMLRNVGYRIRRDKYRNGGIQPPVEIEVHAKRSGTGRGAATREGTFKATIRVDDMSPYRPQLSKAGPRAKEILRWFLQDICCALPKLTFDSEYTWSTRYA
jgi:hypothetical protein